jgi:Flp pilus assembly protein CpaB
MTINYRIRNIVIAAALAAAAVLLTVIYVTSARNDEKAGKQEVTVYVAQKDFAAGTPGSTIAKSLKATVVARDAATPRAIEGKKQIAYLYSAQPIYKGEQLSFHRFTTPKAQGIRTQLKGKQRAYQLPGDANQVLAGTIRPGDRVDVVAVFKPSGLNTDSKATVALRKVLVLDTSEAEGSTIETASGNGNFSVVLAVTDEQAQTLLYVERNGEWALQLRPVKKPKDSKHSVTTAQTILSGEGNN